MSIRELLKSLKFRQILPSFAVVFLVIGLSFMYAKSKGVANSELIENVENYLIDPESHEIARELNEYRDPTSALEETLRQESEQKKQSTVTQDTSDDVAAGNNSDKTASPGKRNPATTPTPIPDTGRDKQDADGSLTPKPGPPESPAASDEPTPTTISTPSPSPTVTLLVELLSESAATEDALGEVEVTVVQKENNYWDFILSGIFENLQPNRGYQIWLCNESCHSHNSAQFVTDENGSGFIANVEITHQIEDSPNASLKVWEITQPDMAIDETTACYQIQDDSPACVTGELSW